MQPGSLLSPAAAKPQREFKPFALLFLAVLVIAAIAVDDSMLVQAEVPTGIETAQFDDAGSVLFAELIESSLIGDEEVSQVSYSAADFQMPDVQPILYPDRGGSLFSGWAASADVLSATRSNEDILYFDWPNVHKLGTGTHGGVRLRLARESGAIDDSFSGMEAVFIRASGEEQLRGYYDSWRVTYESNFTSLESNVVFRSQRQQRDRKLVFGVRYAQQDDSMVTDFRSGSSVYQYDVQAINRMLGVQVGFEQAWRVREQVQIGCGMKTGQYFSRVEDVDQGTRNGGFLYVSYDDRRRYEFPLIFEYHADIGYQFSESTELGFGVFGMRLEDQHIAVARANTALRFFGLRLGLQSVF